MGGLKMVDSPTLQWQYDEEHDINDGKPWSQDDLDDLALALKDGGTIEGAATFLCRWGTQDEGRRKAEELGLLQPSDRG
jgi:hypothetical protein